MSRLQEYNPEFGVVFDEWDDILNATLGGSGAGGGGTAPPKPGPAPNNERPAGTEVSPGRIVSPNLLTTYLYNPTTGWAASPYPPGADDKKAAAGASGTARPGGGSTSTYTRTPYGPNSLEAIQASTIARRGSEESRINPRTGEVFTRGGDGTWRGGFFANARDVQADLAAWRAGGGTLPGTAPTPGATPTPHPQGALTPEARAFAGLAGTLGTLDARGGPLVPGFGNFTQPGIGIPSEGRQTMYTGNGLNTLYTGGQGSAQQIPIAPGFRGAGAFGNQIHFAAGASGGGRVEPQMAFPSVAVSVPGSYVRDQGNVGDGNRAYSVPFNIGAGGAGLMNIGGSNVQLNSADKGVGFGYTLGAMPSSSFFSATGRQADNDPAIQAAQTLQLIAAINQMGGGPGAISALTAANPNQYGGFHAGTNNGPFSGNGGTGQGTWFQGYNPDEDKNRGGSGGAFGFGDYSVDSRG